MSDAHEQIRNLLGLYCERMDAGDFDGLGELFADGRLADEHGRPFCEGSAAMATMWHQQTKLYDGSPRTRHVTANPIIELDDGAGTATVRSSYIVFQHVPDVLPLQPIITGRYHDRFVGDPDGNWHWDERRYFVDHVGDLSHHLGSKPAS